MFTGIVEGMSTIVHIEKTNSNIHIWLTSMFIEELKIDQSIAHNGICLTIDQIEKERYRVTAIKETIEKTTLGTWTLGQKINTERCLALHQRLDGHIVQGHIEALGTCILKENINGSINYTFRYPMEYAKYLIEKGSICIDGISLTCHSLIANTFIVSLIPYTLEHTNASEWIQNSNVNLEFDIIGKYLYRNIELSGKLV